MKFVAISLLVLSLVGTLNAYPSASEVEMEESDIQNLQDTVQTLQALQDALDLQDEEAVEIQDDFQQDEDALAHAELWGAAKAVVKAVKKVAKYTKKAKKFVDAMDKLCRKAKVCKYIPKEEQEAQSEALSFMQTMFDANEEDLAAIQRSNYQKKCKDACKMVKKVKDFVKNVDKVVSKVNSYLG